MIKILTMCLLTIATYSSLNAQDKKAAILSIQTNTLLTNKLNDNESGLMLNKSYLVDISKHSKVSYDKLIKPVLESMPIKFENIEETLAHSNYQNSIEENPSNKGLSLMVIKDPSLAATLAKDLKIGLAGYKAYPKGYKQEPALSFIKEVGDDAYASIDVSYSLVPFTSIGGNGTAGVQVSVKVYLTSPNKSYTYSVTANSKSKFKVAAGKLIGDSNNIDKMIEEAIAKLLDTQIAKTKQKKAKGFAKYIGKM